MFPDTCIAQIYQKITVSVTFEWEKSYICVEITQEKLLYHEQS